MARLDPDDNRKDRDRMPYTPYDEDLEELSARRRSDDDDDDDDADCSEDYEIVDEVDLDAMAQGEGPDA